ncbi:PaaI family thioesterase [Candidatus Fermentibacteria bacterium]|nr:PaaI family thioesterase [Candidatus Fermentibacteria bacterium]
MASRPMENPYLRIEGYNCFGCSPRNPYGLHMQFVHDEEASEVYALVSPAPEHCGYPGVLHGGIQATLLDEVGYWAVHQKLEAPAFTTRLDIELLKAVRIPATLELRARVIETRRKLVTVEARLLVYTVEHARARITYYLADSRVWEKVTGLPAAELC